MDIISYLMGKASSGGKLPMCSNVVAQGTETFTAGNAKYIYTNGKPNYFLFISKTFPPAKSAAQIMFAARRVKTNGAETGFGFSVFRNNSSGEPTAVDSSAVLQETIAGEKYLISMGNTNGASGEYEYIAWN